MQKSMTGARRVQRRLSAGRRPALPESISMLDAVQRLASEADRAKSTMEEEKLNPDDISLGLLFSAKDGLQEYIGNRWLGAPGRVGEFIAGLEEMAGKSSLTFLGIVWAVQDRETNQGIMWAKPLVKGQEERLQLAKALFRAPHRIN